MKRNYPHAVKTAHRSNKQITKITDSLLLQKSLASKKSLQVKIKSLRASNFYGKGEGWVHSKLQTVYNCIKVQ